VTPCEYGHLQHFRARRRDLLPQLEARKANLAFVELLRDFADRKDATPAQIALAWLLAQRLHKIEDAQLHARGERYPEATQRIVDR
jgi:aryl-alcohol dehydrogenase-like predicted oxidoreductase